MKRKYRIYITIEPSDHTESLIKTGEFRRDLSDFLQLYDKAGIFETSFRIVPADNDFNSTPSL